MSIVALKKKTAAKYNNMSVNVPQFSINGGYRNQGWVGQTSLSRSLPRTPMRGDTARGSGGCCGTYNRTNIVQSGVKSTNNNNVIKESVVSTDGMLDKKYRWILRPSPYSSVKSDNNHNLNDQSEYITRKAKEAINETSKDNVFCKIEDRTEEKCCKVKDYSRNLFKNRLNTPYNNNENYTKTVGPIDESQYIQNLNDGCTSIDTEFQKTQNQATQKTPFGCSNV
jgi:hypothetical protein